MNKTLITFGCIMSLLWLFAASITRGLSFETVQFLDYLTHYNYSDLLHTALNGFYYDTANNDMPTETFLIVFAVIFALYLVCIGFIQKQTVRRHTTWIIIGFAILFRIIMLPTEPVHENDFYRYIWDGKTFNQGINPFKYAPSDLYMYENDVDYDFYDDYYEVTLKAREFKGDDIKEIETLIKQRDESPVFYTRIGHWQVPTIYPPVAQAIFAAITFVDKSSIVWMKLIFVLFDLGVVLILINLLQRFKLNPALSIIYAWSPLVMKEIPNSGHYDSIPIFFMMASVLAVMTHKRISGVVHLCLAALSKFFAGLLYPILLKPWKIKELIIFGAIFIGLYIPFFVWSQTGFMEVFEGLNTYNKQWSYNSSIFSFVYLVLEAMNPAFTHSLLPSKIICALILLVIIGKLALDKSEGELDILRKCFTIMAALFLLNPVGDPWYFCWALPFVCFIERKGAWIMLSGLLMLSYLNFQSELPIVTMRFLDIKAISWIIYCSFAVIFVWEKIYIRERKTI